MLPVRKGTTKRCRYGVCRSDTRYSSFKSNTYYFINFPKPCLQYRKKIIKSSDRVHIETCSKCKKCELWVKKCGRSDGGFRSIDDVTKDTYICSLHFFGESGPTEEHPDPLSYEEFQKTDKSVDKVVGARTSVFEDNIKIDMDEANGSPTTNTNNIKINDQTSTAHEEEVQNIVADDCSPQQRLPDNSLSSQKSVGDRNTKREETNRTIKTTTVKKLKKRQEL